VYDAHQARQGPLASACSSNADRCTIDSVSWRRRGRGCGAARRGEETGRHDADEGPAERGERSRAVCRGGELTELAHRTSTRW